MEFTPKKAKKQTNKKRANSQKVALGLRDRPSWRTDRFLVAVEHLLLGEEVEAGLQAHLARLGRDRQAQIPERIERDGGVAAHGATSEEGEEGVRNGETLSCLRFSTH